MSFVREMLVAAVACSTLLVGAAAPFADASAPGFARAHAPDIETTDGGPAAPGGEANRGEELDESATPHDQAWLTQAATAANWMPARRRGLNCRDDDGHAAGRRHAAHVIRGPPARG